MPALSPTMTQGNIAKWYVKVGDEIAPGTVLADIETDKATLAFENQVGSVVTGWAAGPGALMGHTIVLPWNTTLTTTGPQLVAAVCPSLIDMFTGLACYHLRL